VFNVTIAFNRQQGQAIGDTLAQPAAQPSATSSIVTQLTPAVIQQINQGLLTLVKITTDLPLFSGDRLVVNTSANATDPGNINKTTSSSLQVPHLELKQLQAIPTPLRIQQTITNLVRQLVPTQTSYSPLLNNILALITAKAMSRDNIEINKGSSETKSPEQAKTKTDSNTNVKTEPKTNSALQQLPPDVQRAIKQIIQNLPRTDSLTSADTVKQAIKHSGIFFESALKSSSDATNKASSTDFKQQLLTLEKTLTHAIQKGATLPSSKEFQTNTNSVNAETALTAKTAGKTDIATTKVSVVVDKLIADKIVSTETVTKETTSRESIPTKQLLETQTRIAKAQQIPTSQPSENSKARVDLPPLKLSAEALAKTMHRTTANTSTHTTNATRTVTNEPAAIKAYQSSTPSPPSLQGIPPLPGQIMMQAQPNTKATLKGDEVADALIKILLKQTQASINRLQLHQLATAAVHGDDAAQASQPPLSFDLPILNFNQLSIFHFHIEEENNSANEKDAAEADKKWNVSMGFDIEGLGAMFCELSLINTHIYVKFWAKEKDTVIRAKSYFEVLQNNLHNIGATVKELECIEGLPSQQEFTLQQSLIDIET